MNNNDINRCKSPTFLSCARHEVRWDANSAKFCVVRVGSCF